MNKFTLFWIDGKSEVIQGAEIADAFRRSGYGNGDRKLLDFYASGDETENYAWDIERKKWVKVAKLLGELEVGDIFYFTNQGLSKTRTVVQKGYKDSYCPLVGQDTSNFTKEGGEEVYFHNSKVIKVLS